MATTTSTPVLAWEAFELLPSGDGVHRELIDGELQELPPAKLIHSLIATRLFRALLPLEIDGPGSVLAEAGYKLSSDPASWIQPDVSFALREQVAAAGTSGYALGAPALAVEIVSPSETAPALQRKIELLLANGSREVWVIYPDTQSVQVHRPDGTAMTARPGDDLTAGFLSESFRLPVATLFEPA
jgi:Uma2 family endonuclease